MYNIIVARSGHADIAQQVERILGKDSLYATSRQLYTACADVAQQVERILGKDEVTGANPVISSRLTPLWDHPQRSFSLYIKAFGVLCFFVPDGWLALQPANFHPIFCVSS